jgi:hypothetical protein
MRADQRVASRLEQEHLQRARLWIHQPDVPHTLVRIDRQLDGCSSGSKRRIQPPGPPRPRSNGPDSSPPRREAATV